MGNTKGNTKNNSAFSNKANSGSNSKSASTFIPNNAIKIVAGNARLRIIFLIPTTSALVLNLIFKSNPIPIKRIKVIVFCQIAWDKV